MAGPVRRAFKRWIKRLPRRVWDGKTPSFSKLLAEERAREIANRFHASLSTPQKAMWTSILNSQRDLDALRTDAKAFLNPAKIETRVMMAQTSLGNMKEIFRKSLSAEQKKWFEKMGLD